MPSMVAPQSHEAVEVEERRPFRAEDIMDALATQEGRCFDCGEPIPPFEADHDLPRDLGGKTDRRNLRLRCPPCHAVKTQERDMPMIRKAARLRRDADPETRRRSPHKIRGRNSFAKDPLR